MYRKYEFTGKERGEFKQIRRLTDGTLGGWIECEESLSHKGNCWVSGDAQVSGNAQVYGIGDYWSIAGGRYPVTYTKSDDSLSIGCQRRPVDEWVLFLRTNLVYESLPLLEPLLRAIFAERLSVGEPCA